MAKPAVDLHAPASFKARFCERIIEIHFADGSGCLLSLVNGDGAGPNKVEIYRVDEGDNIVVLAPEKCLKFQMKGERNE